MKKLVLIIAAMLLGVPNIQAAKEDTAFLTSVYRHGNSFIFVEDGVTFSVYPDGEFDFYMDNRVNVGVGARVGNVGITFNSGYNYNPYVQYDDYGAVIQVENIPVFYDYYGRVSQIGSVDIWYRNGRLRRVGGLHVYYNGGVFSHYTGFINIYNRYYVYRPFHRYFIRPAVGFCNVYYTPYRRYIDLYAIPIIVPIDITIEGTMPRLEEHIETITATEETKFIGMIEGFLSATTTELEEMVEIMEEATVRLEGKPITEREIQFPAQTTL